MDKDMRLKVPAKNTAAARRKTKHTQFKHTMAMKLISNQYMKSKTKKSSLAEKASKNKLFKPCTTILQ